MCEKTGMNKMTNITPETRIMMMRSAESRNGYRRQVRTIVTKHYRNYRAMRTDPRIPRCVFVFGNGRHTRRTEVIEQDSSAIQMTRMRLTHTYSKEARDLSDSESGPSIFGTPCTCKHQQEDDSSDVPDGASAAVTVTAQSLSILHGPT